MQSEEAKKIYIDDKILSLPHLSESQNDRSDNQGPGKSCGPNGLTTAFTGSRPIAYIMVSHGECLQVANSFRVYLRLTVRLPCKFLGKGWLLYNSWCMQKPRVNNTLCLTPVCEHPAMPGFSYTECLPGFSREPTLLPVQPAFLESFPHSICCSFGAFCLLVM